MQADDSGHGPALTDGAADEGRADDHALRHVVQGDGGGHHQTGQDQPSGGLAVVQKGVQPGGDGAAQKDPAGYQMHCPRGGGLGQKAEAGHGDHHPRGKAQQQAGLPAGIPAEEGGQRTAQSGPADAGGGGDQQCFQ